MAKEKGGNGAVVADDLVDDIEDAEPIVRASGPRDTVPFVPNPGTIEKITASFGRTGAFRIGRAFPTVKDARKSTRVIFRHAQEAVALSYPDKSAGERFIPNEDGTFTYAVQLTHKRVAKPKEETATETPATETPATETAK